jgi:hypothetical protein
MIRKEHLPNLVSATVLLRTATLRGLDPVFDEYVGATGRLGWWRVSEAGITKIDIVGVDSAESASVSSSYGAWAPTDWDPSSVLDAYAKGGPGSADALRRFLTEILERFEGVVIWPDDRDRPLPQEVWTLEEILEGSNQSGVALFSK